MSLKEHFDAVEPHAIQVLNEYLAEKSLKESLRPGDDMNKAAVKFDNGKDRYELIPPEGPRAVAVILGIGAAKYAPRNWEQGMEWSRPYAAIQRHLQAWWGGEDRDPDTGKSHLWHVCTNAFFLVAYEARGTGTDDRPRPVA